MPKNVSPFAAAEIGVQQAAQAVLGKNLDVSEARLRELLDPVYFVKVTDCRGGVSPQEVARMIADRREKLAAAKARNLKRTEALENAKKKMLSDLRARVLTA